MSLAYWDSALLPDVKRKEKGVAMSNDKQPDYPQAPSPPPVAPDNTEGLEAEE